MKEKINYSVRQNFSWFFKRVRKYQPQLIWQCLALVLLEGLQVIAVVLLPTVLVSSLEAKVPLQLLALRVFGLGGSLAVVTYLIGYIEALSFSYKINVRGMIGLEVNELNLRTAYGNLENSEFRLIHEIGEDNGLGNNSAGGEAYYTHFVTLLRKIGSLLIFSLGLSYLSPSIFLIVLVTTVINYFALKWVRNYREKIKKPWGKVGTRMRYLERNAYAVENGKDIRLYRMDDWYDAHLQKNIQESLAWQKGLTARKAMSDGVQDLTMFGRNLFAYLYLISAIARGSLTLAQFTLFFSILNQLTQYINEITLTINDLSKASQDLNDLRHYYDIATETVPEKSPLTPELAALKAEANYTFTLVDVSYTYPGSLVPTLTGINLTIKAGEKLALVGANGAGKSTLVKLLAGLLEPTTGSIYLNGINLKEIPRDFYYELIAPVFQEATLFAFSLGANVALAEEYDQARVIDCLNQAGLGEKLSQLSDGLATELTTYTNPAGVDFSGGEKQKLMLARALYKDSGMLILDEPTAALDALAENELYEKYSQLTQGKTSLFISHRLASTRFCDRIIFLAAGKIQASGSHEELIAAGGNYAEMYHVQSHYYQKEVN